MLSKLEGLPAHVAGFKASGKVDKDDYENILIPEVERIEKEHGHIHFIMVLETPVKDFTMAAWMQDAWLGLKHYKNWKKIAIVTDEKGIEKISDIFNALIPGKSKGFHLSQLEEAKIWVAEEN